MLDIQNFIGKGSTEADVDKRLWRTEEYQRNVNKETKQPQSRNLIELEKSTPEIEIGQRKR